MSHAAKEVLVKSVLQALPTYCMAMFKMTQGFCEKYEKLIRDFWWGDENGHRKVHWMAWDRMTKPKRGGGIGFKDMKLFNQAPLAKQAWRLIQRPDSLCARVLKSKYYPNGNLVDTVFATDASPFGVELNMAWNSSNWASFGGSEMGEVLISNVTIGFRGKRG